MVFQVAAATTQLGVPAAEAAKGAAKGEAMAGLELQEAVPVVATTVELEVPQAAAWEAEANTTEAAAAVAATAALPLEAAAAAVTEAAALVETPLEAALEEAALEAATEVAVLEAAAAVTEAVLVAAVHTAAA